MKDFFISYNKEDQKFAEWITWQLEEAGYSTLVQAWDSRPGMNFVNWMDTCTREAVQTIAVLSQAYVDASFTHPEWNAAFVDDPKGEQRKLIPVRVSQFDIKGLLKPIVYIDLVGLPEEQANESLLNGVKQGRAKPATAPLFPVHSATVPEKPTFPGTEGPAINLRRKKVTRIQSWRIAPFALLSLGSFVCGVGLLILLLYNSELLSTLGFVGNMYYLILLPLGLSVAAFLFGALRSYARYSGTQIGGQLELGGPIVAFALVVIGGFFLPKPQEESFSVTVYVHGEAGPHDMVLRNTGWVWITLDSDRRKEQIGEKGQADFKNIPAAFRGKEVQAWVDADRIEALHPDQRYLLNGSSIYLPVRHRASRITGYILDGSGKGITGATVNAEGASSITDSMGHFALALPGNRSNEEVTLIVDASGFRQSRLPATPDANKVSIVLRPLPETLPKFTKTIQIKPRMPEGSDLVSGTILMTDGGGRKVAEIANWNERDLTFTLTKGEYSLKVDLRYRTPSGLFRRCEDTRAIAFSNNKRVIITPDCR